MSLFLKTCALAVAVPLVFIGCTTTDPQAAFDGVNQTLSERTGTHLRWMRDEAAAAEMEQEVDGLLRSVFGRCRVTKNRRQRLAA